MIIISNKSNSCCVLMVVFCTLYFQITVEAKEFTGLTRVKQHRLVTDTLKTEIAEMHGIRIHTAPSQENK